MINIDYPLLFSLPEFSGFSLQRVFFNHFYFDLVKEKFASDKILSFPDIPYHKPVLTKQVYSENFEPVYIGEKFNTNCYVSEKLFLLRTDKFVYRNYKERFFQYDLNFFEQLKHQFLNQRDSSILELNDLLLKRSVFEKLLSVQSISNSLLKQFSIEKRHKFGTTFYFYDQVPLSPYFVVKIEDHIKNKRQSIDHYSLKINKIIEINDSL